MAAILIEHETELNDFTLIDFARQIEIMQAKHKLHYPFNTVFEMNENKMEVYIMSTNADEEGNKYHVCKGPFYICKN